MGLSDGERILMMHLAVLTQITHVTDGQTELAWHICAIAYMLSRVKIKKKQFCSFCHGELMAKKCLDSIEKQKRRSNGCDR